MKKYNLFRTSNTEKRDKSRINNNGSQLLKRGTDSKMSHLFHLLPAPLSEER